MVIDRLLVGQELADGSLVQLLPDYQLASGPAGVRGVPGAALAGLQNSDLYCVFQERLFA
jgi:hypothetical protein